MARNCQVTIDARGERQTELRLGRSDRQVAAGSLWMESQSNITFRPYTDLLLHDMGEELADGRPDFHADGREWRTAPLWGIGRRRETQNHSDLLHDGRARNVAEAVLWHGGEAQPAREAFRRRSKSERAALIRFVESL